MQLWFKSYGNFDENSEFILLDKEVKLVGGGSVINGAYPVYFIKKDKKPDTLANIDNYNFYDRQTHEHGESDPA